jgi:hypothetical protein
MISGFITGLLMVASTVGVAILGLLLVRRLVPLDLLQMHHEVGGYIIGVMGTIYAVILAFVASSLYGTSTKWPMRRLWRRPTASATFRE